MNPLVENPLVDDIGSFPFPRDKSREAFKKAYVIARQAAIGKKDFAKDPYLQDNFNSVILDAFKKKIASGIDCVNYPQMYNGINQVTDQIHSAMEMGSFTVDKEKAVLPEVYLINQQAKSLSERFGKKINLRISIFGPMELYLFEVGKKVYPDVLNGYIETVKRFIQNSILNSQYIQTTVVSIDEPSFGYNDLSAEKGCICEVLEKAFDFKGVAKQIHLHSAARIHDLLSVKNIDVLSFEYAASPRNLEVVSKKMLDSGDKKIRVGIARTDIDTILAELNEKGINHPTTEQLVESDETMRKRFRVVKEKYDERLSFAGPDCGLGGWPSQEAAQLLLERTVKAVRTA